MDVIVTYTLIYLTYSYMPGPTEPQQLQQVWLHHLLVLFPPFFKVGIVPKVYMAGPGAELDPERRLLFCTRSNHSGFLTGIGYTLCYTLQSVF